MSRRVVNETVTRVKMCRVPQLVMKSWGKTEIPWEPVRLEWCNEALAETICSENLERDHAIDWGEFHVKTLDDPGTGKETKSFWFDQWRPQWFPRTTSSDETCTRASSRNQLLSTSRASSGRPLKGLSPRDDARGALHKTGYIPPRSSDPCFHVIRDR